VNRTGSRVEQADKALAEPFKHADWRDMGNLAVETVVVEALYEEKRERTFRGMMIRGMSMIVAAPILAWLLFVVI
jgi:hypothetical protein